MFELHRTEELEQRRAAPWRRDTAVWRPPAWNGRGRLAVHYCTCRVRRRRHRLDGRSPHCLSVCPRSLMNGPTEQTRA